MKNIIKSKLMLSRELLRNLTLIEMATVGGGAATTKTGSGDSCVLPTSKSTVQNWTRDAG